MTEKQRGDVFFSLALRNVRLHWVRSVLATIGIVIGVIAIASLSILGSSMALLFSGMFSDITDTLVVTPHVAASTGDPFDPRARLSASLDDRDLREIEKAAGKYTVIPMLETSAFAEGPEDSGYLSLYAIRTEDIPLLLLLEGGVYPRSASTGCIAGALLAEEFDLRPGSRIILDGEEWRITGVAKERGFAMDINPDYAVVVPYEEYMGAGGAGEYSRAIIRVADEAGAAEVKEAILSAMNRKEEVVDVTDSREMIGIMLESFDAIQIFLMGIGAVSVFVSAVSILNVMIISVTERTREIGLLRGIGTRRGEVIRMFLYEALILGIGGSLVGGVVSAFTGIVVSTSVVEMLAEMSYGAAVPSAGPEIAGYILFAMLFGTATSVFAGLYPAWKASRMNPVEALRYE